MVHRDILAIGTSAGGFEALRYLAGEFRPDFPAAVLVVIHLPSHFQSSLDAILAQSGPLTASFATDGARMEPGRIYIGPPDTHLLVTDQDRLKLGRGPRENNCRPAIDPLFRSLALCCGARSVGAVLTGTLGDGASGLQALKQCGGITVVQEPSDADFPDMPVAALIKSKPTHIISLAGMPALFQNLVNQPAALPVKVPPKIRYEVNVARGEAGSTSEMDCIGERSLFTCPDCQGVMWEIKDGDLIRYRCHVGHTYAAELMRLALDENLTRALASGLRALDDRIALAQRLHKQAQEAGRHLVADSWQRKIRDYEEEADVLRNSIRRIDEIAALSARDHGAVKT
ncbi:MAG: chemotaxis protein CheB [Bradyrhizobium sp.]|nr:chemotaxis protein CheB [Bradyrhizobium sp.]